jgi:integrase/recombinase XerD
MKHLPLNTLEFERLFSEFGDFITLKGYSRGKPTSYASNVREFLFFVENRGVEEVKMVRAVDVVDYSEYLQQRPKQKGEGGLSESMINSQLFALRLFFDYLMDMGEVNASPAHLPKLPRPILTVAEIKQVHGACASKMEKALIATAYGCGLRRTELELLDTGDIILSQGILLVREGKGGKSRTVPLSDSAVKTIREYIVEERPTLFPPGRQEATPAFFVNRQGSRYKGDLLNDVLREIISRTQNPSILAKNITLHCLRHSIATHLLDNGAEIEFVQEFLGHSETDTTTVYSKRRKQRLKLYHEINRPVYGA